jgi:phosphoadenosine phosphosulfate reductase
MSENTLVEIINSPQVLIQLNAQLEKQSPQEILNWIKRHARQYDVLFSTAFGREGVCLIHMFSSILPKACIANLDTGYQFKETIQLKQKLERRYGLQFQIDHSTLNVEHYEKSHGGPVYKSNPDKCCFNRKVQVLRRVVPKFKIWVTAIRREQAKTRANAPIVSWDEQFSIIKVNPLVLWSKKEVLSYIKIHKIPYNTLYDQGYQSIGCWPCTNTSSENEDERRGRWKNKEKTECGLHYPSENTK